MLKVVGCFVDEHDFTLVVLAAAICALASFTAIALLRHAHKSAWAVRARWLTVAGVAGGSGIWATHFVAMLAFEPGLPHAYNLGLTALSLLYAIVLTGAGLTLALAAHRLAAFAGGAVVGGGIAAMHYTGMAAYEVPGTLHWDPVLVTASIVVGSVLGGAALTIALSARTLKDQVAGSGLLILAICGHHFTGMGAVTIVPNPAITISPSAIPTPLLAAAVALATFILLILAGAAMSLDLRGRQQAALAGERLRSLANAAVEGLVVCRGDVIVSANDSFVALVGLDAAKLTGLPLVRFVPTHAAELALAAQSEDSIEVELIRADGRAVPVELIIRPVAYGNEPHYAVAVRDLRARRKAERQIQFLAHHDALTGLANRPRFHARLDQEIAASAASGGKFAVMCLDLDRFKEVNDLFGHATGDAMLESVARIVTGLLTGGQMMARLGGDEFAVLMPCRQASEAGRLAERILEALRAQNEGAPGPLVATSIGIALYPDHADERSVLLSYADTALYRAKSEGRGTYRFYEARMGAEVRDRRLLEHDLRHAVARREMHLVYQPQTEIETGEVVGFEALLRWNQSERGLIPPDRFIPLAEESGLILQIGEWVLREACREAARWERPLSIAVNVSGVQIHSPHFVQLVHEILLETGLKGERLEIEITETALISDPGRALLTLRQLKGLGIRIAMDDFGTGYSSLSNLRSFPFDKIKIDRSFIQSVNVNEQAAAIVRSVLGLGKGLGLPVLAEGVETEEEMRFLADEACHGAQGYLIGRPLPIGQITQYTTGAGSISPQGGTSRGQASSKGEAA